MKPTRIIEICANSAQSCVEAEAGGAKRVELCAGIPEGGTTPSYGEIRTAQALTSSIDINVIIRPRGGDFLYTPAEIQSMLLDIELCKQLKVHGVVFGCLTKDGDIDVPLMRRLIETAKPLSVTCHRAFDVCRDPFAALEQLIELGCDRILTSGQQSDAVKGIPLIAELVKRAAGRIIIMPGLPKRVRFFRMPMCWNEGRERVWQPMLTDFIPYHFPKGNVYCNVPCWGMLLGGIP